MGLFNTSGLSSTEKDYFQTLSSLFTYELSKSQLSQEFIQMPEKALKEFISNCERKKIAVIWDDRYAHDPYLVQQSLYVAAKKNKHPEPSRLVDDFISICLIDLSTQVQSLVQDVKTTHDSVLESLGAGESLNHRNYTSILPEFLKTELIALALKPDPTYFKFNPSLQMEGWSSYKWRWRGWINNCQIPPEIELLERLCKDGWTFKRQLKIILHFADNENPLFEVQAED